MVAPKVGDGIFVVIGVFFSFFAFVSFSLEGSQEWQLFGTCSFVAEDVICSVSGVVGYPAFIHAPIPPITLVSLSYPARKSRLVAMVERYPDPHMIVSG
jgi:hypothetical protein